MHPIVYSLACTPFLSYRIHDLNPFHRREYQNDSQVFSTHAHLDAIQENRLHGEGQQYVVVLLFP
jgi:hypothetical protein